MRRPVILSVIFHLSVVLSLTLGWPLFDRAEPAAQPLVIVEMVQTVPKTNVPSAVPTPPEKAPAKPAAPKAAKPKPAPPPPPAPSAKPTPPPPAPTAKPVPSDAEILPDKQAEPDKPAPPKIRQKPAPIPASLPIAKPKPPKKAPPPKAKPKENTVAKVQEALRQNKLAKEQKKQKKRQALTGVLQNLAKTEQASQQAEADKTKAKEQKRDETKANLNALAEQAAVNNQPLRPEPIGQSELDRLRMHIAGCWQPPIGAAGADTLKVDIYVRLDKDGTVRFAEIQDKLRYAVDKPYKVAADAALRAVLVCSPLPLPIEKYDSWKEFIFGFDPRYLRGY